MKRQPKNIRSACDPLIRMDNVRVFVDAYNLIGYDPVLSGQPSFEQSRESLRLLCRRYLLRHSGQVVYLVFDGDSSVGLVPEKTRGQILNEKHEIREVFTETGVTADQWIIRAIDRMPHAGGTIIVTRDFELKDTGLTLGVTSVDPEVFIRESEKTPSKRKKRPADQSEGSGERGRKPGNRGAGKQLSTEKEKEIRDEFERVFGDDMDEPLAF